jgi:hypothetical protein
MLRPPADECIAGFMISPAGRLALKELFTWAALPATVGLSKQASGPIPRNPVICDIADWGASHNAS